MDSCGLTNKHARADCVLNIKERSDRRRGYVPQALETHVIVLDDDCNYNHMRLWVLLKTRVPGVILRNLTSINARKRFGDNGVLLYHIFVGIFDLI